MLASTTAKKFSPGGPKFDFPSGGEFLNFEKNHNYLQNLHISQCVTDSSHIDSECRKRFFRTFRNFLVPGLHVRKLRISRDIRDFRKNDDYGQNPPFLEAP